MVGKALLGQSFARGFGAADPILALEGMPFTCMEDLTSARRHRFRELERGKKERLKGNFRKKSEKNRRQTRGSGEPGGAPTKMVAARSVVLAKVKRGKQ